MKEGRAPYPVSLIRVALISGVLVLGILSTAVAKDRLEWVEFHTNKTHVPGDITDNLSYGASAELSAQ